LQPILFQGIFSEELTGARRPGEAIQWSMTLDGAWSRRGQAGCKWRVLDAAAGSLPSFFSVLSKNFLRHVEIREWLAFLGRRQLKPVIFP